MKTITSLILTVFAFTSFSPAARAQTETPNQTTRKRQAPKTAAKPAAKNVRKPRPTATPLPTEPVVTEGTTVRTNPTLTPSPTPTAPPVSESVENRRVEEVSSPREYEELRKRTQESPAVVEEPKVETPEETTSVTYSPRGDKVVSAAINGALVGLAIPTKYGLSAAWIVNDWMTLEASYFTGSWSLSLPFIDLGGLSETVIAANGRFYLGKSFNFIGGVGYQSYDASIGSSILSRIPNAPPNIDVLSTRSLGLQLGFGNRWQFENGFLIGVDWLLLNFPMANLGSSTDVLNYVNNQGDRERIEDAIRFMQYFPTGAAAKLSLGYSF